MAYDVAAILKVIGASLDDAALSAQRMTAASLDDVGSMAKAATVKSAGVVVDDAAAMPQYAGGLHASRELPVVARIALGSLINKAILIPLALALSVYAAWLIPPLLFAGGLFLCFEGVEGLVEKFFPHAHSPDVTEPVRSPDELEKEKVRAAIRTDAVLSAEIVVIALGTMLETPLFQQAIALVVVALGITAGVYGTVALIVKMDDMGLILLARGLRHRQPFLQKLGQGLVNLMPKVLVALSYLGTIAMLAVGGGILSHAVPALEHWAAQAGFFATFVGLLISTLVGALAGGAVVLLHHGWRKLSA